MEVGIRLERTRICLWSGRSGSREYNLVVLVVLMSPVGSGSRVLYWVDFIVGLRCLLLQTGVEVKASWSLVRKLNGLPEKVGRYIFKVLFERIMSTVERGVVG